MHQTNNDRKHATRSLQQREIVSDSIVIDGNFVGMLETQPGIAIARTPDPLTNLQIPGIVKRLSQHWHIPLKKIAIQTRPRTRAADCVTYFADLTLWPELQPSALNEDIRCITLDLIWHDIDVRQVFSQNPLFRDMPPDMTGPEAPRPDQRKETVSYPFYRWGHLEQSIETIGMYGGSGQTGSAEGGNDGGQSPVHIALYELAEVKSLKLSIESRYGNDASRRRMESICRTMIDRGGQRSLVKIPADLMARLNALIEDFPNFAEVSELIRDQLALQALGDGAIRFMPILLGGAPGIGKTYYAEQLALTLGLEYLRVHMESAQNGSTLSGSSEFWNNSQQGELFNTLVNGKSANPLVVVDELDKVNAREYDPRASLYQLLERETAKDFHDQAIQSVALDASHVLWIITANDLGMIPAPLLSRLHVIEVETPTPQQSQHIARRMYRLLLAGSPWGQRFSEELPDGAAERLSRLPPRSMRSVLLRACGRAAGANRNVILAEDITLPRMTGHSHAIGFHA